MLALEIAALALITVLSLLEYSSMGMSKNPLFAILWCVVLPMVRVIYLTYKAQNKEDWRAVSRSLKLTMLCGVLASVFLATALEVNL